MYTLYILRSHADTCARQSYSTVSFMRPIYRGCWHFGTGTGWALVGTIVCLSLVRWQFRFLGGWGVSRKPAAWLHDCVTKRSRIYRRYIFSSRHIQTLRADGLRLPLFPLSLSRSASRLSFSRQLWPSARTVDPSPLFSQTHVPQTLPLWPRPSVSPAGSRHFTSQRRNRESRERSPVEGRAATPLGGHQNLFGRQIGPAS